MLVIEKSLLATRLLIIHQNFGNFHNINPRPGRLAQSEECLLTTTAIQVQIQVEPHLRPWQKYTQPQFFQ